MPSSRGQRLDSTLNEKPSGTLSRRVILKKRDAVQHKIRNKSSSKIAQKDSLVQPRSPSKSPSKVVSSKCSLVAVSPPKSPIVKKTTQIYPVENQQKTPLKSSSQKGHPRSLRMSQSDEMPGLLSDEEVGFDAINLDSLRNTPKKANKPPPVIDPKRAIFEALPKYVFQIPGSSAIWERLIGYVDPTSSLMSKFWERLAECNEVERYTLAKLIVEHGLESALDLSPLAVIDEAVIVANRHPPITRVRTFTEVGIQVGQSGLPSRKKPN